MILHLTCYSNKLGGLICSGEKVQTQVQIKQKHWGLEKEILQCKLSLFVERPRKWTTGVKAITAQLTRPVELGTKMSIRCEKMLILFCEVCHSGRQANLFFHLIWQQASVLYCKHGEANKGMMLLENSKVRFLLPEYLLYIHHTSCERWQTRIGLTLGPVTMRMMSLWLHKMTQWPSGKAKTPKIDPGSGD